MRLTIVGCAGSYAGPDSPASSYLLETEDVEGRTWRVLLDLGSGSLGALQKAVDPLTIDAVLLTHLHPDHCADLCGYYVMRRYHPSGHQPLLPVWAPEGAAERMPLMYGLAPGEDMDEEFDFRVPEGTFHVGPFEITAVEVAHPVAAYGYRVSADGDTLAYTGDSGPCPRLTDLALGATVLLAEASFREKDAATNPADMHLTGPDAVRLAVDAGVTRVILTHIPAWFERDEILAEARAVPFEGTIALAAQGALHTI